MFSFIKRRKALAAFRASVNEGDLFKSKRTDRVYRVLIKGTKTCVVGMDPCNGQEAISAALFSLMVGFPEPTYRKLFEDFTPYTASDAVEEALREGAL